MPKLRFKLEQLAHAAATKAAFSDWYFRRHWRGAEVPLASIFSAKVAIATARSQVHAIGVGRKIVAGKPTNELSIRLYVVDKFPKSMLSVKALLPKLIDGLSTDIIEAPRAFLAMPAIPVCSTRRRTLRRPIQGGISGASINMTAGTLGAVCRSTRAGEADDLYVLSCSHVLAAGAPAAGDLIVQPALRDGGVATNRIALLHRFASIVEGAAGSNRVDAAIAKLDPGVAALMDVCSVGAINGTTLATPDQAVEKHGRTTGFTSGLVDDVAVDVIVPLSRTDPQRVARFIGQIRVKAPALSIFAQSGDSGALVVTKSNKRAVGLLFACPDDGSSAFVNPIAEVLGSLEASFGQA